MSGGPKPPKIIVNRSGHKTDEVARLPVDGRPVPKAIAAAFNAVMKELGCKWTPDDAAAMERFIESRARETKNVE